MEKENKREKKLVKNTIVLAIGNICTKGIVFLMIPFFTRWLSQSDYGVFDLILTYISLLIPLVTLDCSEALFRFLIKEENNCEDNKKIVTGAFFVNVLGLIIASLLIGIISIFFTSIRNSVVLFIILLIVETFNNFMTMSLRGLKKLPIYALSNIIFVMSMVISVIIFVKILGLGLNGILIGYIVGYFISICFSIFFSKINKYISLKYLKTSEIKEMIKYSIPLIPNALSWWIMDASDRTIVSCFLSPGSNAILSVAHKIPNISQTLYSVFHMSWQENATETMKDSDRDIYYSKIMNGTAKLLISVTVVIMALNFIIFGYVFADNYYLAYYQSPILLVAIVFSMLAQFIGGIYIAQMKTKKNGITTVIAAVINIMVHLSFIKFLGLHAATISTLISYIVLFLIRFLDIRKSINLIFDKKTIRAFYVLIYFTISVYINMDLLNYLNLILAMFYFLYENKMIVLNVLLKIKKKLECKGIIK